MDSYKDLFISLNNINDIKTFVQAAAMVEGDILCIKGKHAVDAKSILGVLSIDVTQGFKVEYPADAEEFEAIIRQFV